MTIECTVSNGGLFWNQLAGMISSFVVGFLLNEILHFKNDINRRRKGMVKSH